VDSVLRVIERNSSVAHVEAAVGILLQLTRTSQGRARCILTSAGDRLMLAKSRLPVSLDASIDQVIGALGPTAVPAAPAPVASESRSALRTQNFESVHRQLPPGTGLDAATSALTRQFSRTDDGYIRGIVLSLHQDDVAIVSDAMRRLRNEMLVDFPEVIVDWPGLLPVHLSYLC